MDMMDLNFDKRNLKFKPEEHLSDLKQWALAGKFKNLDVYRECWIDQVKKRLDYHDDAVLNDIFDEHLKQEKLYLENTDMGEIYEVDPLDFVHNVYNYSAVIIDNGTFFSNQRQILPPAVKVQTYLMGARYEKKNMGNFYLTEGQNEMLGQLYDLQQGDIKISMNTAYGASQNPYSKMYNKALGAAITCKGRSIVATSALIVESVMANYIPHNFDALMTFISEVEQEHTVFSKLLKDAIQADDKMLLDHIGVDDDYYMIDALKARIAKMSQYNKTRLYYKNNLYAWLELPWVQNQIKLVIESMNSVNEPFLDPYEVPKESATLTSDLYSCAIEVLYGYYWDKGDYLRDEWDLEVTHSAQDTIKKMKRKSVTLIDTDSKYILEAFIGNSECERNTENCLGYSKANVA